MSTKSIHKFFVPIDGRRRRADIEWELKQGQNGLEFSASGGVWNSRNSDYDFCGQCLDELARLAPYDQLVQRIVKVWTEWHLNGTNAGTPRQTAKISEYKAAGWKYDYSEACDKLKADGLYEDSVDGLACTGDWPEAVKNGTRGYRYGERWVYRPIPQSIIDEIRSWK